MASVDPHDDPLIHHPPVKQEGPDLKGFSQTLKFLITILRSHVRVLSQWHIGDQELQVRVKLFVDVLQKVFQEFEPFIDSNPTAAADVVQGNEDWKLLSVFVAILNVLRSLPVELAEIDDLLSSDSLNAFRRLHDEMTRILSDGSDSSANIYSENAENLVGFINSLLHNLKDVLLVCRVDSIILVKKALEDAQDRLFLIRHFL
ncbi:hypothetical protein ACH5RR_034381 [Cinchona calisaya]|uniref:Uncharacterized protein n=1 Tax=Cinchona calisaya TaxID=153742 RepID=A0ABD2YEE1_9GENT